MGPINNVTRRALLEALRREGLRGKVPSATYKPNGKREVERRKHLLRTGQVQVGIAVHERTRAQWRRVEALRSLEADVSAAVTK